MASGEQTAAAIRHLLERGRLEIVSTERADLTAGAILERAGLRLLTAEAAIEVGDAYGAYVTAYDAYRMSAEALLARQGLRATGGEGAHVTVEDAVSTQFVAEVEAFAKTTFERFRRTRHAAQYFDPSSPEIDVGDARWAVDTAQRAVDGARSVLRSG